MGRAFLWTLTQSLKFSVSEILCILQFAFLTFDVPQELSRSYTESHLTLVSC